MADVSLAGEKRSGLVHINLSAQTGSQGLTTNRTSLVGLVRFSRA